MRKKILPEEKKVTISVSIHQELNDMLELYSKKNDINKSKLIQDLLKKYFNKND